jgi:hypothetical protein
VEDPDEPRSQRGAPRSVKTRRPTWYEQIEEEESDKPRDPTRNISKIIELNELNDPK